MLDFDEILANVNNPQVKKYVKEAIKSYQVGNYRSAILAIWVATMFDLVKKFEILSDKRNEPTASEKWKNLKPKIEAHKNWESELIESARSADMISQYEAGTLKSLIETRNRYAHPSFNDAGSLFDPTPEEVRYFIRTLYDIVLSQPAQLGAFYVNQLIESLKDPNLFARPLHIDSLFEFKDDVVERIERINYKQIPRLIKSLFKNLKTPVSRSHKLNIICFLINIWNAEDELKLLNKISDDWHDDISRQWDEFLSDQGLERDILEGILTYPECVNKLNKKAQEVVKSAFILHILEPGEELASAVNFLKSADIVPLAKTIIEEAPTLIPLDVVIENAQIYRYLFDDKFTEVFGKGIFDEARRVLKTRNGYKVNPVLSALRKCQIWDLADSLLESEKIDFVNELIESLNSNNWETMRLLDFGNREKIPARWIKRLLEQWSAYLSQKSQFTERLTVYLAHYLGLLERYADEIDDCDKIRNFMQVVIELDDYEVNLNDYDVSDDVCKVWQELIAKYG